MAINTDYGSGGSHLWESSATKLAQGVSGQNINQVANGLAQDAVTVTDVMGGKEQVALAKDLKQLRHELARSLSNDQLHTSMMVAGALLSGPSGVTLEALRENLKVALSSPENIKQLTGRIQLFDQGNPARPAARQASQMAEGLATASLMPGLGMAIRELNQNRGNSANVFESLHNRVLSRVVQANVGATNGPIAMFISGALANSYQNRGGYAQNLSA